MSGKWRVKYISWGEVWPSPSKLSFQTQKEAFIQTDLMLRTIEVSGLRARVYKER